MCKHLVEEWHASKHTSRFTEESRSSFVIADYEAAVIEGWGIFCEPGCDLGLPVDGEEVGWFAVLEGHCRWRIGRAWGDMGIGGMKGLQKWQTKGMFRESESL